MIINGSIFFDFDISTIIKTDDVNEAEEVFILVLEIDNEGIDVEFDEEGGVLVYTILDNNRKSAKPKPQICITLNLFHYSNYP